MRVREAAPRFCRVLSLCLPPGAGRHKMQVRDAETLPCVCIPADCDKQIVERRGLERQRCDLI